MPFTFVFNGTFESLSSLFHQLDGFALRTTSGGVQVSGRLLTVQSVALAPGTSSESGSGKHSEQLSGTITATAYVLPAGQTSPAERRPRALPARRRRRRPPELPAPPTLRP